MTKQEERRRLRAVRDALPDRERKSERICTLAAGCEEFRQAEIILTYLPFGSEVDTSFLNKIVLDGGKRLFAPVCTDRLGHMEFYPVVNFDSLVKNSFGIPEPPVTGQCLEDFSDAVCILPALGFDRQNYRLGYGGGYYDRFLSVHNTFTIGLCFKECLCENLPHDENDIPASIIITD